MDGGEDQTWVPGRVRVRGNRARIAQLRALVQQQQGAQPMGGQQMQGLRDRQQELARLVALAQQDAHQLLADLRNGDEQVQVPLTDEQVNMLLQYFRAEDKAQVRDILGGMGF